MDPLSVPVSPTAPAPDVPERPSTAERPTTGSVTVIELNDAEYCTRVLQLPLGKSEAEADEELLARASAVGITATLPSLASQCPPASSWSDSSFGTPQDRLFSNISNKTNGTGVSTQSSAVCPPSPLFDSEGGERRSSTSSLTFAHYERYISTIDSGSNDDKPAKDPLPIYNFSPRRVFIPSPKSMASAGSKKSSFQAIKERLFGRKKKKKKVIQILPPPLPPPVVEVRIVCTTCRDSFEEKSSALHKLKCGHIHCVDCVKTMIKQAVEDETLMPPSCCSSPLTPSLIRAILNQDDQDTFLLAVVKLNTPADEQLFCPDPDCGHFIPPQDGYDVRHPFDLACVKCNGRMCGICKDIGHGLGEHCPLDWELTLLKKKQQQQNDKEIWRRCYQCRNLVSTSETSQITTCLCKAQFCSVCTGIWDPITGCPNLCSFEDELQRRRIAATLSSINELKLRSNPSVQQLEQEQQQELHRFMKYKFKTKDALQTRHLMQEATLEEKYELQEEAIQARHKKTLNSMEVRHLKAEMELQDRLNKYEDTIGYRIKHMEGYCNGLGRNPSSQAAARTVTEKDLRELGHHYHIRDTMEQIWAGKINVMRERQDRQQEDCRVTQENELETFMDKRQEVLDKMEAEFLREETHFNEVFAARQRHIQARWVLAIEVLCREFEQQSPKQACRRVSIPKWPEDRVFRTRNSEKQQ
ncbi:hypothetical protein TGAMA5MH_08706 [Trichoderma gamsii]|uniref:RBR-type E3 ubiquitin transferase n=1 Tax=Trichoderma gamsii TaxID=398673 RepID=A0A2K0T187_9HYPO|nr:hypothetical protein TGAMA5MH_08706 [Trichoderma gamsii]